MEVILLVGALYVILRLVDTAANYFMASVGHIMGAKIETDMRRDVFAKLQRLSHSFFDNAKVGQLMSRITNDLFEVTEFAHHCPEEFFIAALKISVSFVILADTNLLLTLIIFAIVPVMLLVTARFNHQLRNAFAISRHKVGELNAQLEDSLLGVRVVKSFANES
jgi:ATP-binding cassette subfamily B protein